MPTTTLVGVSLFGKKASSPLHFQYDSQTLIPGRALESWAQFGDNKVTHFNLHNAGWDAIQTNLVCKRIREVCVHASSNITKHAVIVTGDLNLPARQSVSLASGLRREDKRHSATNGKALEKALDGFTELLPSEATHYNTDSGTLNFLDRTFVYCPAWVLASISSKSSVLEDPTKLSQDRISDHAPVRTSFSKIKHQSRSEGNTTSIPNVIARDPLFKKMQSALPDC